MVCSFKWFDRRYVQHGEIDAVRLQFLGRFQCTHGHQPGGDDQYIFYAIDPLAGWPERYSIDEDTVDNALGEPRQSS